MAVVFIDTSVLCNLLRIPGKAQHQQEVHEDYRQRREAGDTFVLPLAAVVETGNHIEQLGESLGYDRRRCAESLVAILRLVAGGDEPWVLHELAWDAEALRRFCEGTAQTPGFVEVAAPGHLGGGDLTILIERARFAERVRGQIVELWTYDQRLAARA